MSNPLYRSPADRLHHVKTHVSALQAMCQGNEITFTPDELFSLLETINLQLGWVQERLVHLVYTDENLTPKA